MQKPVSGQTHLSKLKIIETAAALVRRQGWNATGINQILTDAKTPKGSFYYYFHSKDELGVAIVKFHQEKIAALCANTLANLELTGREGVLSYFKQQIELQRQGEWILGCPIGSFSNEVAGTLEQINAACAEALKAWITALEGAIARGQKDGSIQNTGTPESLAQVVASLWEGALVLMKTFKNDASLQGLTACIEQLFSCTAKG